MRSISVIVAWCFAVVFLAGCSGSTEASKSGSTGAVVGALAGGLLGGSWSDAATGAAVGGGLGYISGNEKDKKAAEAQRQQEVVALQQAQVTSNPATAYRPPPANDLVGSTWRVISYVSDHELPDWASIIVSFPTNTKVSTLILGKDGSTDTSVETYRIIDDALIVSSKDYVLNAKFAIENGQMIVIAPDVRMVLEHVQENI